MTLRSKQILFLGACLLLPVFAFSYYADDCREIMNTRLADGSYKYWKRDTIGRSILKDEANALRVIKAFYRAKYIQNQSKFLDWEHFCKKEKEDINSKLGLARKGIGGTGIMTGSSAYECRRGLLELCKEKFQAQESDPTPPSAPPSVEEPNKTIPEGRPREGELILVEKYHLEELLELRDFLMDAYAMRRDRSDQELVSIVRELLDHASQMLIESLDSANELQEVSSKLETGMGEKKRARLEERKAKLEANLANLRALFEEFIKFDFKAVLGVYQPNMKLPDFLQKKE